MADDECLRFVYLPYAHSIVQATTKFGFTFDNFSALWRHMHSKGDVRQGHKTRHLCATVKLEEAAIKINGQKKFCALLHTSSNDDFGLKSFPGMDDAIENARSLNAVESWHAVQREFWRSLYGDCPCLLAN
ncbi:hypothetical protein Ancab_016890 [Ancistrocladus abbreviatus]